MADEQVPQAWVGEDVVILGSGSQGSTYGRLESVGEVGVVLRHRRYVGWFTDEVDQQFGTHLRDGEYRLVSELFPWHIVEGLRLQEEEERKTYGLE